MLVSAFIDVRRASVAPADMARHRLQLLTNEKPLVALS